MRHRSKVIETNYGSHDLPVTVHVTWHNEEKAAGLPAGWYDEGISRGDGKELSKRTLSMIESDAAWQDKLNGMLDDLESPLQAEYDEDRAKFEGRYE